MNSEKSLPNPNFPSAEEFELTISRIYSISDAFHSGSIDYRTFKQHADMVQEQAKKFLVVARVIELMDQGGANPMFCHNLQSNRSIQDL